MVGCARAKGARHHACMPASASWRRRMYVCRFFSAYPWMCCLKASIYAYKREEGACVSNILYSTYSRVTSLAMTFSVDSLLPCVIFYARVPRHSSRQRPAPLGKAITTLLDTGLSLRTYICRLARPANYRYKVLVCLQSRFWADKTIPGPWAHGQRVSD